MFTKTEQNFVYETGEKVQKLLQISCDLQRGDQRVGVKYSIGAKATGNLDDCARYISGAIKPEFLQKYFPHI